MKMRAWALLGVPLSIVVGVVAAIYFCRSNNGETGKKIATKTPTVSEMAIKSPQVMVDGHRLGRGQSRRLEEKNRKKRKAEYRLGTVLDIIAVAGETIKVGGRGIEMDDMSEKIRLEIGDIVETDLKTGEMASEKSDVFGIHILKFQERLPDIHFEFLKELVDFKGMSLTSMSSESNRRGAGFMVGKILAFSEHNAYIYDIKKKRFTSDVNLLEPNSKIVIYRLGRVSSILDSMDGGRIDGGLIHSEKSEKSGGKLYFDGDALWMRTGKAGQKT